jgi:hypothetical protein
MANRYGLRSLYHQMRRRFRTPHAFEVRYRSPAKLRAMFSRFFSQPTLFVDGYFGLGIQKSDMDLMPPRHRMVIAASELLRAASIRAPWMHYAADSLYVHATGALAATSSVGVRRRTATL